MKRRPSSVSRGRAGLLVFAAALLGLGAPVFAQTPLGQVEIAWNANTSDLDLAGYRVYAHTDPNTFRLPPAQAAAIATTITVGTSVTSQIFTGLDATRVWYFAVTCLDLSGNESVFAPDPNVGVVSAQPSVTPTVRSVSPASGKQGLAGLSVTIAGGNFVPGSTVGFGAGVTVNSVDTSGAPGILVANISIDRLAQVSSRSVVVTNPGGASGSKSAAFSITLDVERLDIDLSGRIDNGDFVDILLSFPAALGDALYRTTRDLDMDGKVDGADLAILFTYFGLVAPFP